MISFSMSNQIKTTTNIAVILEQNGFEKISGNLDEIVKFVQKMKGSEHILFLWENEESKNRMISEFFIQQHRGKSSGLFSIEPTKINEIKNILYPNFYNTHKSAFIEKAVEKVTRALSVRDSNMSIRFAFEDDTWLMKRGLKKEVLDTEEALGKEVDKNLSLFCMNHVHSLEDDEGTIEKLIKAHGYVLLDVPLSLYKWRVDNNVAAGIYKNNSTSLIKKCDCEINNNYP
ncbi:MAG: hypothetical protein DA328_08675 [Nitrososphaeraceae archaeon]|nr:hypothetical protein [Nitrososphaeraceae archaeon]